MVIFSSNYFPKVESARSTSDDRDALGLAPQAPSSLGQSSLGPRCAQSPGNTLIKMHDLAWFPSKRQTSYLQCLPLGLEGRLAIWGHPASLNRNFSQSEHWAREHHSTGTKKKGWKGMKTKERTSPNLSHLRENMINGKLRDDKNHIIYWEMMNMNNLHAHWLLHCPSLVSRIVLTKHETVNRPKDKIV